MISVVVPTRNPHRDRWRRSLASLQAQTLPRDGWELLVIDNGSESPIGTATQPGLAELRARIVAEPEQGLTAARLAGVRAARGDVLVFVDDDNLLDAGYLAAAQRYFAVSASLGAAGGPVVPEWEITPPPWTFEFHALLALRDLGQSPQIARGHAEAGWPRFAPVGAGLCIRRSHAVAYADAVARMPQRRTLDRTGSSLASGGDNDLVFTALHAGGDVGYFPELRLTHLIPAGRLAADYLASLNRGIMRTWVRVLAMHGQCPWPAISRRTVPLRAARAWLRRRAWRSPAARIRWAGDLGQFEGQADCRTLHLA